MKFPKPIEAGITRLVSKNTSLPDYALQYFDSMTAQFDTLIKPSNSDAQSEDAFADATKVVTMQRSMLRWEHLMLLDLSIVRLLDLDRLLFKIADLRERAAGASQKAPSDLLIPLDKAEPKDLPKLRAEGEMWITRLWQIRMARNSRDQYVGELRQLLFQWMLGICVVILLMALIREAKVHLFFVLYVAGMTGALISILRRLQAVLVVGNSSTDFNADLSALANEKRAALISLFSGGVFAVLLYFAFAAGLSNLALTVAPEYSGLVSKEPIPGGASFFTFVTDGGPKTGVDYAKTVVWSFAAGFFEQFVPDVLDRLVKRGSEHK